MSIGGTHTEEDDGLHNSSPMKDVATVEEYNKDNGEDLPVVHIKLDE